MVFICSQHTYRYKTSVETLLQKTSKKGSMLSIFVHERILQFSSKTSILSRDFSIREKVLNLII